MSERCPTCYREVADASTIGAGLCEVEVSFTNVGRKGWNLRANKDCAANAVDWMARALAAEAELAAARSVPPDVEEAIETAINGAVEHGRASEGGRAHLLTIVPTWTIPRLRAAIAKAISDARGEAATTVGGLLATEFAGVVEFRREDSRDIWQVVTSVGYYGADDSLSCRFWNFDEWEEWRGIGEWLFPASNYRQPARLVPAAEADLDPATRGPIGGAP